MHEKYRFFLCTLYKKSPKKILYERKKLCKLPKNTECKTKFDIFSTRYEEFVILSKLSLFFDIFINITGSCIVIFHQGGISE